LGSDFDLYEFVGSGSVTFVDPLGNFSERPDKEREHTKNKRKSTKEKHEKGRTTAKKNRGGEKGDERRRGNPNKRGGRTGGKIGGAIGIWLCLEGTACAAEPPSNWRDPRFSTICECNCDCEQYSLVEIVPDFWNLAGIPETYSPVKVNEYSPGATSADGCYAEEGIDDVEITHALGYTIYNTTYTVCSWGGAALDIPDLRGSNPDCFCDPCGTGSSGYGY
jgi:hypothetical protein